MVLVSWMVLLLRRRQFGVACPRWNATLRSNLQAVGLHKSDVAILFWLYFYSIPMHYCSEPIAISWPFKISFFCGVLWLYLAGFCSVSIHGHWVVLWLLCNRSEWLSHVLSQFSGFPVHWFLFAPCVRYFMLDRWRLKLLSWVWMLHHRVLRWSLEICLASSLRYSVYFVILILLNSHLSNM